MGVQQTVILRDELAAVFTAREALAFWGRHARMLGESNCHLILSSPDGSFQQQPVLSLGDSGRLFSAFSGDRLFFLDASVAEETYRGGKAQVGIDSDFLFDSNAASLLRRLTEGRDIRLVADLRAFLRERGGRINWNHWLYLNENRAAVKRGERLDHVFATILASEQLASLDLQRFAETGEWCLRVPLEECMKLTQRYLADWHRLELDAKQEHPVDFIEDLFACAVLKMVLLQLEAPSPRQAQRKFRQFLTFLHEELFSISAEQAWCAWHLFSCSQIGGKFFRKIQRGSSNLIATCANMTMDLCHWHWFQTFASFRGRQSAFLLPHLLTFDQGLGELLSGLQWRAALIFGTAHPMPIHNFDLQAFYVNACGQDLTMDAIFSPQAAQFRESKRNLETQDFSALRNDLTEQVAERFSK